MSDEIRIIDTADGSKSIYHRGLNETYHSTHGAITESQHVFIKHGVDYVRNLGQKEIRILEVGFGTGLNALLAQAFAVQHSTIRLDYTTLEPFPLSDVLIAQLDYHLLLQQQISKTDFQRLHYCEWGLRHEIAVNFLFTKHQLKLQQFEAAAEYDVIFYDAFAPSKQSEMWEKELIEKTVAMLSPNSILVTYCAKGQLKRDLAALGLKVETLSGPPGKKEMVRALK